MLQGDGSGAEGQRVVDLMQGHEHGEPVLLVQIAQRFHNVAGRFRIERGNGLVRQQDAGALHKGAGNGGALLLPAGEVGGTLMRLFHDADAGQRLVGKPGVLFMEEAQQAAPQRRARQRAEHDVAQNGHAIHQIELLEDHFAIDLITTTKLGLVTEDRVLGAYVLDRVSGEVEIFRSDRVLLATGGCGRVYLYTTNNDSATGDGVAMAWRAGATIANMEFVQFHPTCFFNTRAEGAEARSFLISEAVRGEGGVLIGADGKEFMHKYDPRKSLAPRDITARAVDSEMKRTGSMCVYLDISHKPEGFVQERFPLIYETCNRYGVNPAREPIPVVPAAHFQCGGVLTDVNGQTSLDGLYAAGETGCTGLHGANRLASNSLLECVVVAKRALNSMLSLHPLRKDSPTPYDIPAWHHGDTALPDELSVIYHNWDEIRRLMWDYVSIVRTNKRLDRAATRLRMLHREVKDFYWGYRITPDILELRNLVAVASLIVDCAMRRNESRGLHFNTDYPGKLDHRFVTQLHRW